MAHLYRFDGSGIAIPPGETITEALEYVSMTVEALAAHLELDAENIDKLIEGSLPVTAEIAEKLETVTGIRARMWLRLEENYRRALARYEKTKGEQDT